MNEYMPIFVCLLEERKKMRQSLRISKEDEEKIEGKVGIVHGLVFQR